MQIFIAAPSRITQGVMRGSDQSNLSEVFKKLRDVHEKKLDVLFKDVIMLARIHMACPVTSVECERSFSAMRRLNYKDLAVPSGIAGQGGPGILTPASARWTHGIGANPMSFFGGIGVPPISVA